MSFENIANSFKGIVDAVRVMLTALPVGVDDKAKIDGILADLHTAAAAVLAMEGEKIVVRQSDVEAAVAAVLPPLVEAAVKHALETLAVDTPSAAPVSISGNDPAVSVTNVDAAPPATTVA